MYADTLIRRTSDGTVVARIADQTVVAFSWDGSRLIASPGLASVTNHEVRLLDWQRGQILWRLGQPAGSNPGDYYVFALPRPGGTDFMVGVAVRAAGTGDYPAIDQLWQVRASGAATAVAKGPIYPGF